MLLSGTIPGALPGGPVSACDEVIGGGQLNLSWHKQMSPVNTLSSDQHRRGVAQEVSKPWGLHALGAVGRS